MPGSTKTSAKIPRTRTVSISVLSPRDELLRESIRCQVASEPYAIWTKQETLDEATRLAKSFALEVKKVRKAIYNRRAFVNSKIEHALVDAGITDPASPFIQVIAEKVQTISINVVHFLETHFEKIRAEIGAKKVA